MTNGYNLGGKGRYILYLDGLDTKDVKSVGGRYLGIKLGWLMLLSLGCLILSGCEAHGLETAKYGGLEIKEHQREDKEGARIVTLPSAVETQLGYSQFTLRRIRHDAEATGQLQPNANAVTRISSPVSGRVVEVNAAVGDRVDAGRTLFTVASHEVSSLESELFHQQTEIDADLATQLVEINFDLQRAHAGLALSQKQLERAQLLLSEKIGSQAAFDMARTEFEKDKITVEGLLTRREKVNAIAEKKKSLNKKAFKDKLRLFGMREPEIEHIINDQKLSTMVPICSTRAGIVLERSVNTGELVDPSKILFVVDDLDSLWLIAEVYEQDIELIKPGQSVEFTVDSLPGEKFHGRLNFVAGAIEQATRTLPVRAEIANPHLRLKPKMFARMKILVSEHPAMTVPKEAVQDAGSFKVVFVPLGQKRFEERKVTVGEIADEQVEILSGLKKDETVVSKGSFALRSQCVKAFR